MKLLLTFFSLLLFSSLSGQNKFQANDSHILYEGRIDFAIHDQAKFSYQGVSIKCKFNGKSLRAVFTEKGSGGKDHTNYINVIIDDKDTTKLKLNPGKNTYDLALNLKKGTHTVEVIKITESFVGIIIFHEFITDSKSLLPIEDTRTRSIEFIGDSWMTGYGNEVNLKENPNTTFHSENENYCKAWPYLLAKEFNATHYSTAYSGIGVIRDGAGDKENVSPKIFDQIIPTRTSKWDFEKHQVDLVVVGLGANDLFPEAQGKETLDSLKFCEAYAAYLTRVHETYPKAEILCVFGSGITDSWPSGLRFLTRSRNYVTAIQNSLPFKTHIHELTTQRPPYGEDWHPAYHTHLDIANQLSPVISKIKNW